MPIAISPEQRALQASIREPAEPAVGNSAAEGAAWEQHWRALAGLGVFSIALPAAVGLPGEETR